ncbi:MAG: sigma-54 dependent transcriptional regulator, partial [Bacilli bacterium]
MNCNKGYKILIVDDEIEYQRVFSYILSSNGYSVKTSSSGAEALEVLKENEIDLVITDLKMPGIDGIELIKNIHEKYSDMDIMVMTAFGTIESAVKSMKYGANGYFIKGSEPESFIVEIDKLSKIKELQSSNAILKESNGNGKFFLETKSHEFAKMLEVCKKAAKTDINVHLSGESGVGKEVIANYIHQMSNRKDNHFIAVNCQVFPEGMVESELFGHEKGAFTGATEKRIGRFENANFGTLFLDEIGDLPIATQGKLLRVLETRTIERVGSSKNIELDIRLISATNKKLSDLISRGEFREDLMYRINTIDITIPPLRDRREDIPSLIEFFIMKIQTDQKKKIVEIEENTL